MKKLSLFMLMAVELLISTTMSAGPAKVAPTREAKPDMPQVEIPQMAEPQPFQQSSMFNRPARAAKGDIPQIEENQQKIAVSFGVTKDTVNTLQAAFNMLPKTNTPATVKLLTNVFLQFEGGDYISVTTAHQNILLDLNGYTIYSSTTLPEGSQVIKIGKDAQLTIDDSSEGKNGKITNASSQPDNDWGGEGQKQYPGYGNYTITNDGGTLILNNGIIENATASSGALYAVHCSNYNGTTNFIINGGHVIHANNDVPIRLWGGSKNNVINFEMNGGTVEGGYTCIFNQYTTKLNVTINGGELIPDPAQNRIGIYVWANGSGTLENTNITVNGGKIGGYIYCTKASDDTKVAVNVHGGEIECSAIGSPIKNAYVNVNIDGGTFINMSTVPAYYGFLKYQGYTDPNKYWTIAEAREYYPQYIWADYHEYDADFSIGQYLAAFEADGTYYTYLSRLRTKEEVEIAYGAYFDCEVKDYHEYSSGQEAGVFWAIYDKTKSEYSKLMNNNNNWILPGYAAVRYSGYGRPDTDLIIETIKKGESQEGTKEDYDDDSKNTTGWHQTTTWTNNIVPDEITSATIAEKAKVVIEGGTTANAYQIILADSAKLIVEEGATIIIGAGGIQRIGDITGEESADTTTIIVQPGGTMIATSLPEENTGVYVHSDDQNAGILLFDPSATETQKLAHVDLTTYCRIDEDGNNFWQMVAIPVDATEGNYKVTHNGNNGSFTFAEGYSKLGSWLCKWNYEIGDWEVLDKTWKNEKANENFIGYDLSNTSSNGGVTYTFEGTLIGNQNIDFVLPKAGYSILGNSYTAPMDVLKLFEQVDNDVNHTGSSANIEEVIYVYNSKLGYYECTTRFQQELHKALGNAYPISFTAIAPMQGFLMNLMGASTTSAGISVDYAKAIFGGAHVTKPAYAPKSATTDYILADINVTTTNANDHLMLVEGNEFSSDFENGKDAYKYMNKESINLYVINNDANYAAFATDNLEGTYIAFQSNEQTEYTISFTNCFNNDYVLVDLENNQSVAMTNGQIYHFTATPNTLNPSRFVVMSPAQAPTELKKTSEPIINKGIYTVLGQYMGSAENWNNIPSGVYIVNGQTIFK